MSTEKKKTGWIAAASRWYARFERPISSISLVGGFVFDAVTLQRVDLFWENLWVVAHLAAVALCIFLINFRENVERRDEHDPTGMHFWLIAIMQFFFGGLLSTFLVYYFRSGTLAVSWPFMLMLAAAFVANERLRHHYSRLVFQISILFLSLLSFLIFIVPVLVHAIGPLVFLASGGISLVIICLFLATLRYSAQERFRQSRWPLFGAIAGIFAAINFLYFYHLIPPLPLSLKDAGIYNSLAVNSPGNYTATSEKEASWQQFLGFPPQVQAIPNAPLYAYTAVFSPAAFNLSVIHEWQHYDASKHAWATMGQVTLRVSGGRDGGYRTFSEEVPRAPGKWRVNVKTTSGEVIGRIDFNVAFTEIEPALATTTIN